MIKLSNNFYLSADRFQFIIKEKKITQTGKGKGEVVFNNIAFYPNLYMIFEFIFELNLKQNLELSGEELSTLKELKEVAEDSYENLHSKLAEISTGAKKWLAEEDA